MSVVYVKLTRETLALIIDLLEEELERLEESGECEKDLIHCIQIQDALNELPNGIK